jgi:DNA-binding protein WhiA
MLSGLMISTQIQDGRITASYESGDIATVTAILTREIFSKECEMVRKVACGRERFFLSCDSKSLINLVKDYGNPDKKLLETVSFKCGFCEQNFLKGVFLAAGSVNDPQKSYHAEFSFADPVRAEKLDEALAELGIPARKIRRSGRIGLYYKKESDLEELFAKVGANNIAFEIINSKIEKDIRNNENRATNFVATNISRSVSAAGKHIDAIIKLKERGRFEFLPDDLKMTAELRLTNDDISLSELASIHKPPISKSGLNHRLEKLLEEAEKLK